MKNVICVSVVAAVSVACWFWGGQNGAFAKQATTSASKLAPPKVSRSVPKGWIEDFALAKTLAKAGHKHILLAFSGSDWCGWCVKLGQDVYTQNEFIDKAKRKFVLVMIDNPRNQDSLSTLAREQNRALTQQFAISGFPSAVICDATGTEIGRIEGYVKGGPAAYLKAMEERAKPKGTAEPMSPDELDASKFFVPGVPMGAKIMSALESVDTKKTASELIDKKISLNKAALEKVSAALAELSGAKSAAQAKTALTGFESAVKAYFKVYLSAYGQWPLSPEEIAGEKEQVAKGTVEALEFVLARTEAKAAKDVYEKKRDDMKARFARMKAK